MSEVKTVFKVCREVDGELRSAVIRPEDEDVLGSTAVCLRYLFGVSIQAPQGSMGILVFDTLKNAKKFVVRILKNLSRGATLVIVECTTTSYPRIVSRVIMVCRYNLKFFSAWQYYINTQPRSILGIPPEGTHAVDSLIPGKVVKVIKT